MVVSIKTILCLANSRKKNGRCVAGREIVGGQLRGWIRPVSDQNTGELSLTNRKYTNGDDPQVLDVIKVPLLRAYAHSFQIENHLINARQYWSLERKATFAEARLAVDGVATALWDNQSSSYNGIHDRVSQAEVVPAQGSLRLVEVTDLVIQVEVEGAAFGNPNRKVRGQFTHQGVEHLLAITDPLLERHYKAGANGMYQVGNALLCVSLSEPWSGWMYKLIAAVIRNPT